MSPSFENLAIVENKDKLRYATIRKVIDHQFVGSMWRITTIYNKLHRQHYMWRRDALSCECKKCYLLGFSCWSIMTVLFGSIMCATMHHAISQTWMVLWIQAWQHYVLAWGACYVYQLVRRPVCWCVINILRDDTCRAWFHLFTFFRLDDGVVLDVLQRYRWLDFHVLRIADRQLTMRQHSTWSTNLCDHEDL